MSVWPSWFPRENAGALAILDTILLGGSDEEHAAAAELNADLLECSPRDHREVADLATRAVAIIESAKTLVGVKEAKNACAWLAAYAQAALRRGER